MSNAPFLMYSAVAAACTSRIRGKDRKVIITEIGIEVRKEMTYMTIQLENGKYLSGELIGKLVTDIVNKFAEAGLAYDEAKIILNRTREALDGCSAVQKIN